jgi:hypothetical protein
MIMKPVTISVLNLCGEFCIDENDVTALAETIISNLDKQTQVLLDFSGVDTVLTAFFNGLMGKLFEKFDYETLHSQVGFVERTPENVRSRYEKSLQNARAFYSAPADVRNTIKEKIDVIFKEIDLDK